MITKEEVQRIAALARLELTEKEIEKMQKDLSSILDYFNLLKELKPSKGKSSKEILPLQASVREDISREKNSSVADDIIRALPDKKERHIKVKSIL